MGAMSNVIVEQYAKLPILIHSTTCTGKTYIVTGGNSGLGLETARHLVRGSALRVILAVRNTAAGEKAKADIERSTGRKGVVQVWKLDLSSFDSVKKFATKVSEELDRIDVVVQNAGVNLDSWTVAEGMETTMTVNVVSTMLLAVLLMPKLMECARIWGIQPRQVFTVSALGFTSPAQKELAKGGKTNILKGLEDSKKADMNQR